MPGRSRDLGDFVKQLTPAARRLGHAAGGRTSPTERSSSLRDLLSAGDIVIDGGNSFYQDDIRHADMLRPKGIHFVDVGTSGGVWGFERGYCMMIGGDKEVVDHLDPIFKTLAPGTGNIDRTARPRGPRSARRTGLPALRPGRRRTFRQDGAQRYRIRGHAGLCRGFRYPALGKFAGDAQKTAATTSTCPTSPRCGGAAA